MSGAIFRQLNARPLARPIFDIEQRGIGDRKLGRQILLPFQLLVDQGEPLFGVFAAGRFHCLMIRLRWSETVRAKKTRKSLGMNGADNIFHRLHRRVSASSSLGIRFACGFWRASHRAMTGNSVRIEPSSRSRVGTLAFALTPAKGGLNCAPS